LLLPFPFDRGRRRAAPNVCSPAVPKTKGLGPPE
jgi:hypothetical protein